MRWRRPWTLRPTCYIARVQIVETSDKLDKESVRYIVINCARMRAHRSTSPVSKFEWNKGDIIEIQNILHRATAKFLNKVPFLHLDSLWCLRSIKVHVHGIILDVFVPLEKSRIILVRLDFAENIQELNNVGMPQPLDNLDLAVHQ